MANRPGRPGAVDRDAWGFLRRLTAARIALGRAGVSQPTAPHLAFQQAHALARDAVHAPLDVERLAADLGQAGIEALRLHGAAVDRAVYLQRPDLGRRLDDASRGTVESIAAGGAWTGRLVIAVADGLSATAVQRHAVPLLQEALPALRVAGLEAGPVAIVEQGRVAVADEIGGLLGAALSILLIGERPGLSAPDSLGVYLTFGPRIGRTDAERNCISNIRPAGLSYREAAYKLVYLAMESLRRGLSGVSLKDEAAALASVDSEARGAPIGFLGRDPD